MNIIILQNIWHIHLPFAPAVKSLIKGGKAKEISPDNFTWLHCPRTPDRVSARVIRIKLHFVCVHSAWELFLQGMGNFWFLLFGNWTSTLGVWTSTLYAIAKSLKAYVTDRQLHKVLYAEGCDDKINTPSFGWAAGTGNVFQQSDHVSFRSWCGFSEPLIRDSKLNGIPRKTLTENWKSDYMVTISK